MNFDVWLNWIKLLGLDWLELCYIFNVWTHVFQRVVSFCFWQKMNWYNNLIKTVGNYNTNFSVFIPIHFHSHLINMLSFLYLFLNLFLCDTLVFAFLNYLLRLCNSWRDFAINPKATYTRDIIFFRKVITCYSPYIY